jgi:hypothetical protein
MRASPTSKTGGAYFGQSIFLSVAKGWKEEAAERPMTA